MDDNTKPTKGQGAAGTAPRKPGTRLSINERERIAVLGRAGRRIHQIARLTGRAPKTIERALAEAAIEPNRSPDRIDVDAKSVAEAYLAGGSLRTVSRRFGISRNAVARRLELQGVAPRDREHRIRITELVSRYQSGKSIAGLAHELKCSWGAVAQRLRAAGVELRSRKAACGKGPGKLSWDATQRIVRIKTGSGEWTRIGRLIWERAHGPVDAGCVLVRIDTALPPKRMDRLENLAVIDRRALAGRRWARGNIALPHDEADRRTMLICVLLIATLKAGCSRFAIGSM